MKNFHEGKAQSTFALGLKKYAMKVYKFGGTSVGTPERMKEVLEIAKGGAGLVVLSAISGTTNQLDALAAAYEKGAEDKVAEILDGLSEHYARYVESLLNDPVMLKKAYDFVHSELRALASLDETNPDLRSGFILSRGELISTYLFHLLCTECGVDSRLISALDFISLDSNREPSVDRIGEELTPILASRDAGFLLITQGFICRNHRGEIANLGRGGSDYTASLIGAAVRAEEIQIWTDIDGMHNNDPRVIEGTRSVERLSYDEAAELAYFGAKILHPACVHPAKKAGIPIRLKNTMSPESPGTVIDGQTRKAGVVAIAAKDEITVIKIRSARMLLAHGFLQKVFEVFGRFETAVDMVTTSEVSVSVTIDDDSRLFSIVNSLSEIAEISVEKDQTIVCIVGDFIGSSTGYASQIFTALADIPVRMISYGGSKNNVSILVETQHKEAALRALHQGLFTQTVAHV